MQLTSIEQCHEGMTVYHPIYGEGEITAKDKEDNTVCVDFQKMTDKYGLPVWFYEGHESIEDISHLYTEPVFICKKSFGMAKHFELDKDGQVTYYSYQPVNKEK